MIRERIRVGQIFNVPYKRYNSKYELEEAFAVYKILNIYADGSVLAKDTKVLRNVKRFSKEALDEYLEHKANATKVKDEDNILMRF